MTQDVTVIHSVVGQASVLLQRMPWVMSTGELFWPTKLGICRFLQSDRAVRMESLFLCRVGHAKPRNCARHLPCCNASSRLRCHHAQSQAALQGTLNVSLLCPLTLGHCRKTFLFNKGHVPMFPRCCCCVHGEKPRRRLMHRLPSDHPKTTVVVDFDSGQWSDERACRRFIVEELMKVGQGFGAAWGTNSDLPHRCREGCKFSLTECQKSPRNVFPQELSHLNGWSYATLSSGMSVVTSCASVNERIHSSSSHCFEVGSFSFFRNITCVLSKKRHSSRKSPVAHLIVRVSSPRNRRLL